MKKLFLLKAFLLILAAGFVSCGDDSGPADYDSGNLIGSYTGNCVIQLGTTKLQTINSFPAEFKQNDTKSLYLGLGNEAAYKSIGISIIKTATGFKDYGNYVQFNVENINVNFTADQIPEFFKNNIDLSFEKEKMTLKLTSDSKNPPTFIKTSKILTVTYTGSVEITGSKPNQKYSDSITYSVNVNKK